MVAKAIKRRIRRLAHRLGIKEDWEQTIEPEAGEQPPEWYDKMFVESKTYCVHYVDAGYYALWSIIVDRIIQSGARSVLDIGCGPGQLAQYLWDRGLRDYVGLDFSSAALEMARRNNPVLTFVQEDARFSDVYERVQHDVVICTEVLEHIEEDLAVLERFRPGRRCLCTVPNFPCPSHVRHFKNAGEVAERYGAFFDILDVLTFKGTRFPNEEFFLLDGVRNNHRRVSR